MVEKLKVPDELKPAFQQIQNLAPDEIRDNEQFKKSILVYLKLGGIKLARQHLQVVTKPFCEDFGLVKKQPEEIPGDETGDTETTRDDEPAGDESTA